MIMDQEPILFSVNVPANTRYVMKERVKGACTVENLMIRFFPGQQLALRVEPYILRDGNTLEPMITYSKDGDVESNVYVAGDDDKYRFNVKKKAWNDEYIYIVFENTDSTYAYDGMVIVTLDYLAGQNRVV